MKKHTLLVETNYGKRDPVIGSTVMATYSFSERNAKGTTKNTEANTESCCLQSIKLGLIVVRFVVA